MHASKVLNTLSLVTLLSLPLAANARTVNLFETDEGYQKVPEQANPIAAERGSFADLATMTIADLIAMEINGEPITVQVHMPSEEGEGNGTEVVVFSPEFPEGIAREDLNNGGKEPVSPVPLPAAAWLMMSGIAGLAAVARRRQHGKLAV
ncbi:MAG: VPLPA-CTERM sorting domain-containing protein [Gammaproteobacteria bacterium]|jgi:hypothetical protein|nr:VPLPA-CTERM sorting domain-containing protein [Gammaproteobacteria bacterium]